MNAFKEVKNIIDTIKRNGAISSFSMDTIIYLSNGMINAWECENALLELQRRGEINLVFDVECPHCKKTNTFRTKARINSKCRICNKDIKIEEEQLKYYIEIKKALSKSA